MNEVTRYEPPVRVADEVYTLLVNELGNNAPPRSVLGTILRHYDEARGARQEPALAEASLTTTAAIISQLGMAFTIPGGGQGMIKRLGDRFAIDIINALHAAGIKFMTAPPE